MQLIDLPGIIEGTKDWKRKGRRVRSMARTCNLKVFFLEAVQPLIHKWIIETKLEGVVFWLNINMLDIDIKISLKGGGLMLNRAFNIDIRISNAIITNITKEYKLNYAEIYIRGKCGVDDLIDAIEEIEFIFRLYIS